MDSNVRSAVRQVSVPLVVLGEVNGFLAKSEPYCSATKISPQFLVSAAHCVEEHVWHEGNLLPDIGKQLYYLEPWNNIPQVATVAKIDRELDIVLLRIQSACPCASLGEMPKTGDGVAAVGYPMGMGIQVLTEGRWQGLLDQIYANHTAQIAYGNSGGGVFNAKGDLVGVNSKVAFAGAIIPHLAIAIRTDVMRKFLDGF